MDILKKKNKFFNHSLKSTSFKSNDWATFFKFYMNNNFYFKL